MSFSMLNVSSMYPGYLTSFHANHPEIADLPYDESSKLILEETTEFAGAYTKNFRKLGVNVRCTITNDLVLKNKWLSENKTKSGSPADLVFDQVKSFNPDVLWLEDLSCINTSLLRRIRNEIKSVRLIIAYHCAPYNQSVLEKLKAVDFVFTCTPGIRQDLENQGIRSFMVYHGFDAETLSRLKLSGESAREKFIFSGSLFPGNDYHNQRIQFIERLLREDLGLSLYVNLEKSYKISIKRTIHLLSRISEKMHLEKITRHIPVFEYGKSPVLGYSDKLLKSNHSPLFGINMYDLFNRSDIVLNMHVGVAGEFAGNMRMFEVTGVGSCLLTDNKKNLGDLFDIDNEIVVYDSVEDCIEKVKWLIDHEVERKIIASAGQKKTLEKHTVENRSRSIFDIITSELQS
jgi:spore maturation protein CgeB